MKSQNINRKGEPTIYKMSLVNMLQEIKNNDYRLPDEYSVFEAVKLVMGSLSSPDGELRDDLGYTILFKWLIEQKLLNGTELKNLLEQAQSSKMLYFEIGEIESDSVFLRSFSSLLIALILHRDNEENLLGEEDFQGLLCQLTKYCSLERDFRSFVDGKGWAHAPAHISDALDECVKSRFAGLEECIVILNSIKNMLGNAPAVFDAEEDERMAIPVIGMIVQKKVKVGILVDWLHELEVDKASSVDAANLKKRINIKHFIRCLYMRLKEKSLMDQEEERRLFQLEHRFNPNFFDV
ncbi:DUF2785 domain-containing protein [Falsibacillus albus]|uniref:DUF2785 domain-containing protein n=1 Tax=Falsibacillus albus TaxID=2478915 RepID=A0A3L7K490_9BACI|nr:DUF2785 domain-containing protein [Falsibacillus albus]RLQ97465.1 DUF2785 domain-containing protein [Falsibacillus albus]